MRVFKVIGFCLLAVLAGWLIWDLTTATFWPSPPLIADLSSAFDGTEQLPRSAIETAVNAAKNRMTELNSEGGTLKLIGGLTEWISFGCTAAITIILGYFGRAPAGANATPDTSGLSTRIARTIGVLAAFAAVLTAAGSMAKNAGQDHFDRSNSAAQIIREAQRTIGDTQSEREAQDALDEMTRKVQQL